MLYGLMSFSSTLQTHFFTVVYTVYGHTLLFHVVALILLLSLLCFGIIIASKVCYAPFRLGWIHLFELYFILVQFKPRSSVWLDCDYYYRHWSDAVLRLLQTWVAPSLSAVLYTPAPPYPEDLECTCSGC